ncbi:hypothetical protein D3C85_1563070 [compost metagenome]
MTPAGTTIATSCCILIASSQAAYRAWASSCSAGSKHPGRWPFATASACSLSSTGLAATPGAKKSRSSTVAAIAPPFYRPEIHLAQFCEPRATCVDNTTVIKPALKLRHGCRFYCGLIQL